MASSKKIISLVVAIAMVIGVFAVSAFAVAPAATITLSANAAQVESGDTITITVTASASEDFYVGPFGIPVEYDSTLVTFVSATVANVFGSGTTDYAVNSTTAGKVAIAGWPTNAGSPVAPNLNGNNVVLATLTFTATADGTAVFSVDDDQKTTANPTGLFYMGSFDGSNPKTAALTEMGQTLTTAGVSVTIGASGVCALILTSTGESYGTVIRDDLCTTDYDGCVFGIPTLDGEDILDYVTTEVGSVEVTENSAGEYSTGAEIVLKDAGDNVVATYVFIYFGDVNGDAAVDISDAAAVEAHDGWVDVIDDDTAAYYAADVNYDGSIDISDAAALEAHDGWVELLEDQDVIAAGFDAAW